MLTNCWLRLWEKRVIVPHYGDVILGTMASQITSLTIVYLTVYSGADQRYHQSSASLAFVRGILRGPVNSPHKWLVTWKMFLFDDVIMWIIYQTPQKWPYFVNALWSSDAIGWHKTGSTLTQVMACCLTALNHYQSMVTNLQLGFMEFTWGQFQGKCSRHLSLIWV